MEPTFKLTVSKGIDSILTLSGFTATHSLQVNFGKNADAKEYCFTFVNDSGYSSLSFTFITELGLYSHFKLSKRNGNTKYVSHQLLKESEQTVDISECTEFSIIIPREINQDARTLLTLTDIKVM